MSAKTREIIERTFAAVAFTDVGEREAAIRLGGVTEQPGKALKKLLQTWESHMSAVAFAEVGEHEEARRWLDMRPFIRPPHNSLAGFLEKVGLERARVCYGAIPMKG